MDGKSKKEIKIALVISDAIFRSGMEFFIGTHENMNVHFATDKVEALKEYIATHKDIAICIADWHLHKDETAHYIEAFKHAVPDLKFVLFSKAVHPYNVKKAIAIGCNGIMDKYADAATVVKALLNVHYTGSFYESGINPNELEHSKNELITDLELKVLKNLCTNKTNREICEELNMNRTILTAYKNLLFKKLSVSSREMLIKCAYTLGLIER